MNARNRKGTRAVETFNECVKVGAPVSVRKDDGSILHTRTRSEAWILSGHTPVVMVDGISGAYLLERVSLRNLDPGEGAPA